MINKKRVAKSYQGGSDDEDDEHNGRDDDDDEGGDSDGSDGFVDKKIQPRRKRQEVPEPARKHQKIDRLEDRRLNYLESQRTGAKPSKDEEDDDEDEDDEDGEDEEDEDEDVESDLDDEDDEDEDPEEDEDEDEEEQPKKVEQPKEEKAKKKRGDESDEEMEAKPKKTEKKEDPEKDARTVFVGNLPVTVLDKVSHPQNSLPHPRCGVPMFSPLVHEEKAEADVCQARGR